MKKGHLFPSLCGISGKKGQDESGGISWLFIIIIIAALIFLGIIMWKYLGGFSRLK